MSKANPYFHIETTYLILFLLMASCLLIKFVMKRKFHCFHLWVRRKLVQGSNRVHFLFSLSCVSCIVVIYEFDKVFSTDVNVNMIMKIHLWKRWGRGVRTQSNIYDEVFFGKWEKLQNSSNVDVWQGYKYATVSTLYIYIYRISSNNHPLALINFGNS